MRKFEVQKEIKGGGGWYWGWVELDLVTCRWINSEQGV